MKLELSIFFLFLNWWCQAFSISNETTSILKTRTNISNILKSHYVFILKFIKNGVQFQYPAILMNKRTIVTCKVNDVDDVDSVQLCDGERCRKVLSVSTYGKYSFWKVNSLIRRSPKFFHGNLKNATCNVNQEVEKIRFVQISNSKLTCKPNCQHCDVVICNKKVVGLVAHRDIDGALIVHRIKKILAKSGYRIRKKKIVDAILDKSKHIVAENTIHFTNPNKQHYYNSKRARRDKKKGKRRSVKTTVKRAAKGESEKSSEESLDEDVESQSVKKLEANDNGVIRVVTQESILERNRTHQNSGPEDSKEGGQRMVSSTYLKNGNTTITSEEEEIDKDLEALERYADGINEEFMNEEYMNNSTHSVTGNNKVISEEKDFDDDLEAIWRYAEFMFEQNMNKSTDLENGNTKIIPEEDFNEDQETIGRYGNVTKEEFKNTTITPEELYENLETIERYFADSKQRPKISVYEWYSDNGSTTIIPVEKDFNEKLEAIERYYDDTKEELIYGKYVDNSTQSEKEDISIIPEEETFNENSGTIERHNDDTKEEVMYGQYMVNGTTFENGNTTVIPEEEDFNEDLEVIGRYGDGTKLEFMYEDIPDMFRKHAKSEEELLNSEIDNVFIEHLKSRIASAGAVKNAGDSPSD